MYKGVVIQYSNVNENPDGTYSIEVLGHTNLTNDDMVDLVKVKASELCKSDIAEIDSFEMGTYGSHTQFGSVYPPKINAIVSCQSE